MRFPIRKLCLAVLCGLLFFGNTYAGSLSYCDKGEDLNAAAQDRLLRVANLVRKELERSGQSAALISRSGLALGWIGERYSHIGVAMFGGVELPWSVRQLYFACDEARPRLFDQGLGGFVMGVNDADEGYISIVTFPTEATVPLALASAESRRALAFLAERYSANAYPFSVAYQNCNQWVAELLAAAWGGSEQTINTRSEAQEWLRQNNYEPSEVRAWAPFIRLAAILPWLNIDDHPDALIEVGRMQFSLPPALEAWGHKIWPQAERTEICYTRTLAVIHQGWDDVQRGCTPRPGDRVVTLADIKN